MGSRNEVPGLPNAFAVGERVFLRLPELRDGDEYRALRHASESFLRPWEPEPPPGVEPNGVEAFRAWLRERDSPRRRRLLVCHKEDGRILGAINVNEIVRGAFQSAYLGYWIGAEHARQGYMTEALALCIRHAFEDMGLHRLEANLLPENEASRALARGAGFRREGYSERYLQIAGEWRDHERWAITVEEWRGPMDPAPRVKR